MSRFLSEESGAASAEYALIVVMIGLGLGVAVWGMGGAVANGVGWASAQIAQATSAERQPASKGASASDPGGGAAMAAAEAGP